MLFSGKEGKKKLPVVYFRVCTFISLPPSCRPSSGWKPTAEFPFFALLFAAGEVSCQPLLSRERSSF